MSKRARLPAIAGVIFDLDGVLTDTAECHYQAWKRLADEEGIPFDRKVNEHLRGVSRRRSLEIMLGGRTVPPDRFQEMMDRKNGYYNEMILQITPDAVLPGALDLLRELRAAGLKVAIGSASENAAVVVERLALAGEVDAVADGRSVERSKPAPDLFRYAANLLGVEPARCLVVEDATSGIDAALLSGMWAVGLGPAERVGHAHAVFPSLKGVHWRHILAALQGSASAHPIEPEAHPTWFVAEDGFDLALLHAKETVFTIGNGYLSTRGAFEEGYPGEWRTTLIHGVFDAVPTYFTELANAPDWLHMELLVEGERFRLDRGQVLSYRRTLNLRNGLLTRSVRWRSPAGHTVDILCERFCSLADEHLLALRWTVTAVDFAGRVELRAALDAHTDNLGQTHLRTVDQGERDGCIWLLSRTRTSQIDVAAAARLDLAPKATQRTVWDAWGQPTLVARRGLKAGQALTATKFVALHTSRGPREPAEAALATLADRDFDRELQRSAAEWNKLWATADIAIEGDEQAQRAVRYNVFQLLVAAPRHDFDASIGARSLSGFDYRGHVFWDTESFILPMFTHVLPEVARNLLLYRYRRLPGARRKAAANHCAGAQFPWESADTGDEVTPPWLPDPREPGKLIRVWTGDIQIHITADIAYAVWQYWQVTGDDAFMRDYGAELILDGAVFWGSRAQFDPADGRYHIRDVIGPDEYHDHVDDNAFTNAMARWHLERALDVLAWLREHAPDKARELAERLDLSEARLAQWREIIRAIVAPAEGENGLIEQCRGFFQLDESRKVLKQPDVLMLLYLLRGRFGPEALRVNWDYYAPRTDHLGGSSLGPSIHAILGCWLGRPDEAYELFLRAAMVDLDSARGRAAGGVHAASAGGLWQAVVFGFGGLRLTPEGFETRAALPRHWRRLGFTFLHRGSLTHVSLGGGAQ